MYIHAYIFTYTCIHTYIYDISLHIFGGRRGKKRGGKHIHTLTHTYIHMIHREAGSRKPSKKKGGEGKHIEKISKVRALIYIQTHCLLQREYFSGFVHGVQYVVNLIGRERKSGVD
jgi:hypothetical protein